MKSRNRDISKNWIFSFREGGGLSTLFFLFPLFLLSQNSHPYFRNYTTEDGLPSPEVYHIIEDNKGYMWFSTDNGISRFDGYEFKNYGPEQGLKHHVALFLQKDSRGKIWVGTLNGHLYFLDGDSILPYKKNYIIDSIGSAPIIDFYIDPFDNTKYLSKAGKGILAFLSDGRFIHYKSDNSIGAIVALDLKNRWIASLVSKKEGYQKEFHETLYLKGLMSPLEITGKNNKKIKGNPVLNSGGTSVWLQTFGDSIHLFSYSNSIYSFEKDSLIFRFQIDGNFGKKSIIETIEGEIFIGMTKGKGLQVYNDLNSLYLDKSSLILPNISVSAIYKDSENGWWISTLEDGVFYCPNIKQKIFDSSSGLTTDYVSAISFKNKNELFLGLRNGDIFHLNSKTEAIKKLPPIPSIYYKQNRFEKIIYDLVYSKKLNELWISDGKHFYLPDKENEKWKTVWTKIDMGVQARIIGKQLDLNPSGTILWGGGPSSFGAINIVKKEKHFYSPESGITERIIAVKEDFSGKVWVGNTRGLFEFKYNQLEVPKPFFEAFNIRVEDIDQLADSTLVIATKGAGILLWKYDSFRQIKKINGLTSNMIENVHVDSSGTIWVGTLEGLNKIELTDSSYKVRNYYTWHGLPSNEITQVRSDGNQIWIATTKGLLQWKEPQKSSKIPKPNLEEIFINNQLFDFSDLTEFSHNENNFEFHFLTLNYRVPGKIPYRFRLNDGEWTKTQNRSVNYANLAPGEYLFEVQSLTQDGLWSESTKYLFQIMPAWWATWWFQLLLAGTVCSIVFLYYKNRNSQLKKEARLQKEINDLEKAALQAQMNPHFIFNALNSIQTFIIRNDSENAVDYLSKFANLTRRILKSSAEGKILLKEEIDFLKNYLSLEQLRFNKKFEFEFNIDKDLDLFETEILPLLIQPWVENAIKHGMKGKSEGGLISVQFNDAANFVSVKITDNGSGIFNKETSSKLHKSRGMSITARRLEILDPNMPINVKEIKDDTGNVTGTEIHFFVKKI